MNPLNLSDYGLDSITIIALITHKSWYVIKQRN